MPIAFLIPKKFSAGSSWIIDCLLYVLTMLMIRAPFIKNQTHDHLALLFLMAAAFTHSKSIDTLVNARLPTLA